MKIVEVLKHLGTNHQVELPVTKWQSWNLLEIDHNVRISRNVDAEIVQSRKQSFQVASITSDIEHPS